MREELDVHRNVEVKSWVGVSGRCPISYYCDSSGAVDFMFGNSPNDFEFGFDADSLREFLKVGTKALREMDHRLVEEENHAPASS